ncbi:MAG: hypothetical protein WBD36_10235 [Bacteroidota bacterium]
MTNPISQAQDQQPPIGFYLFMGVIALAVAGAMVYMVLSYLS